MSHVPTFRHVNLERRWPLVERSGLQIDDAGALALARVPSLDDAVTDVIAPVPGLDGPVGVGVDACGNLYVADPAHHRILRVDACDDCVHALPCLGGPGTAPGELLAPRGVVVGPRGLLYIADSGNHRVQLFDLGTGGLRGVWGQSLMGDPVGSDAPGRFHEPWDLAADGAGRVYVADPGVRRADGTWEHGRVQRFDVAGTVDAPFSAAMAEGEPRPGAPIGVAVATLGGAGGGERLLVLDRQPSRLLVYALDGTFDAAATARWATAVGVTTPEALLFDGGTLYVADAASGRVLLFDETGHFLGAARGASRPVAGLGIDCHGRLVAHPGAGGAVRRALGLPAFAECGTFVAGPYEAQSEPTRWQRIELTMDALPDGAHVRLFTLTSDTLDGGAGGRPDAPAPCDGSPTAAIVEPDAFAPAPLDVWRAAPWDAGDLLALNVPARHLWIGGVLQGDGSATPVVAQLRVTHDEDGWLPHLPALYHRDYARDEQGRVRQLPPSPAADGSRAFLERALALFESVADGEERLIDDLPLLFDPGAAPDARPDGRWLDWLAGWLGVALDDAWPDDVRRGTVASAFAMHARRGTRESLRRLVALYAGATPRIEELADAPGPWSLGAVSTLGFDTALAQASPQGAVLATTAVVDHSHLIGEEDHGAPLFDATVHHFAVQVYAAELRGPDALDRVRQVLDREKPAHTTYHLCAIEARMRVGVQARLGIDAIVGGPPRSTLLGEAADAADGGLVLAASAPGGARATVGPETRVGPRARVT